MFVRFVTLPWWLAPLACADHTPSPPEGARILTAAVTEIVVEVDYEQSAEPWFTPRAAGGKPWGLVRVNMDRLLSPHGIKVSIPESVDELQSLGRLGASAAIARTNCASIDAPSKI